LLLAVIALPTSSQTTTGRSGIGDSLRGHVAPCREVALGMPIEAVLRSIEIDEGEQVSAGQLLARLDDRLQVVVVESARLTAESDASVQLAVQDLEEANENLSRLGQAFKRGAATDTELRQARIRTMKAVAAHTEAKEARELAAIKLELEQRRLEQYRLVAPFDGTITRVVAEVGAMLTAEDDVLVLVDLSTLEARINVPARLYWDLDPEAEYTLIAGSPVNDELVARLKHADPVIDSASQTFRCVFAIDNHDGRLPAGFAVSLQWPPAPASGTVTLQPPNDR
jgi:RND family efflux transporter MFP subunit